MNFGQGNCIWKLNWIKFTAGITNYIALTIIFRFIAENIKNPGREKPKEEKIKIGSTKIFELGGIFFPLNKKGGERKKRKKVKKKKKTKVSIFLISFIPVNYKERKGLDNGADNEPNFRDCKGTDFPE